MEDIYNELIEWLQGQPIWIQEGTNRIINNGAITEEDLEQLFNLCKSEAGVEDGEDLKLLIDGLRKVDEQSAFVIESIDNIKNVNALFPKNPLEFGDANLAVVYGRNGSGKSSYTRILKHICGAKNPGNLYKNIYTETEGEQGCTIKYKQNNKSHEVVWEVNQGVLDVLRDVEIYDSDSGFEYVDRENEVTYEPWVLSIFSKLTEVGTNIQKKLNDEIERLQSVLFPLPSEFNGTDKGQWYNSISHTLTEQEVEEKCLWREESDKEIERLTLRIAEKKPEEKAKELKNLCKNIKKVNNLLSTLSSELSEENCQKVIDLRKNAMSKRKIAIDASEVVFNGFPVESIDTSAWKALWNKAREFSEGSVYPYNKFPNTNDESVCVLCLQSLSKEAKSRMLTFEEYINGSLEQDAQAVENELEELIKTFTQIPDTESLELMLDSSGINLDLERNSIVNYLERLSYRKDSLLNGTELEDLPPLPEIEPIKFIETLSGDYEKIIKDYEEDATGKKSEELNKQLLELKAQKWVNQQKQRILDEITILNNKLNLEKAKRRASSRALSVKKSALSEKLITDAYVERFKRELETLGASHLKLELVKSRTQRGQVLHEIKLISPTFRASTKEILSEGEQRIVSLAAFLADVEGKPLKAPFVFDDPISSLDIDFEEATVNRLIELSKERQVIVFTHRISLVNMLESSAKRNGINSKLIGLWKSGENAGEPGDTPLFANKPDKALNKLADEKLSKATKIYRDYGEEAYQLIAKGICSEFRIILERLIETVLLGGIVERFKREVNTKGKIHQLPKIKSTDCELFEEYMTKYSKFEHSQSIEAPVSLPQPDELKKDMEIVINWIEDFKKR